MLQWLLVSITLRVIIRPARLAEGEWQRAGDGWPDRQNAPPERCFYLNNEDTANTKDKIMTDAVVMETALDTFFQFFQKFQIQDLRLI